MFRAIHDDAPQWMNNNIFISCEIHNRQTRNTNFMNAHIPGLNKEQFRHAIQYRGAKYWNQLPVHIKMAGNLQSFQRLFKNHFLQHRIRLHISRLLQFYRS